VKLRSLLFAPGDSPRKIEKALATNADGLILDLEDSVVPAQKASAREATAQVLAGLDCRARGVVVRINPRGTEWYLADLAATVSKRPALVMLPKCTGPHDLAALDHHLEVLETAAGLPVGEIGVLALVTETASSLATLSSYAGAAPRLTAMCFGAEDLSADMGITPRGPDFAYRAPIAHARAATLAAAAAAGVPALDTPWTDPRDPDTLAAEAQAAAADGFAGKLLIHPAQIDAVNAAFTPPPDRVAWATAVRDAFAANPGAGVMALDGKMIDRPHLKLAQRILAAAG
jgi:citrate lyase subunit beta/citryl-CoA lyase